MKFTIIIESDTQPGLIHQIECARTRLCEGGTFLNIANKDGYVDMSPDGDKTQKQFDEQYDLSHPKSKAEWITK